jgi:hypothetical protein
MRLTIFSLLLLLCAACGSEQSTDSCTNQKIDGTYEGFTGSVVLTYCIFAYYSPDLSCKIEGIMDTDGSLAGDMDVQVEEVTGTCGTVPDEMTCTYSLGEDMFSLHCGDVIEDTFLKEDS